MSKYYIQLFSPHGLVRYHNPEIGRDSDTGGQVKYVLELIEALSSHEDIRKVDLFTRRISDRRVSPSYAENIETISESARIVRIKCGGQSYKKKESLWNYLDEFVDNTIRFIKEEDDIPDLFHGHYADGNYIARLLSKFYRVPFLATGHSLGMSKQRMLLEEGMKLQKINSAFKMDKRIQEEELTLKNAHSVITSTNFEILSQYKGYKELDKDKMVVIPPGINDRLFYPYYRQQMPSFELSIEQEQALHAITSEIERFLFDPNKPLILSIGRPDKRKNFETIIEAYGRDKELQTMANLAIFAGVRKDIGKMPEDEQTILTNLLLLMDKYDLYGKLAIPKKNDPNLEIPEIYRLAARKKGVFINATPGENFGLTLVEAAACGLPVIASPTGGPKEILETCENGILTDVTKPRSIAKAVKDIIADSTKWDQYSNKGIQGVSAHYSWSAHVEKYMDVVSNTIDHNKLSKGKSAVHKSIGNKLTHARYFLVTDLDGTLISETMPNDFTELEAWLDECGDDVVFGIATGRNQDLTRQAMNEFNFPDPDLVICSAGSELFYTKDFVPDDGWMHHISYRWNREKLERVMGASPKLKMQEKDAQWEFKLSYYVQEDFSQDDLANIYHLLDQNNLKVNVLLTDNLYLDFLPYRASKGNALKYLSYKWNVSLHQFITSGNGGNDKDMILGKTKGIVVANHSPEMEELRNKKDVYFAKQPLVSGIMEGIRHHIEK